MLSLKNKILIVAPHQDDEILGCGGYIRKNIEDGSSVTVLFITDGWSGVRNKKMSKNERIKIREDEAIKAGKILGIDKFIFLRKDDRSIYADKTLLFDIVKTIQTIQPDIVLSPHEDDDDLEHQMVNKLTKEAAWLAKEGALITKLPPARQLKEILFYEVWSPIKKPTIYLDITKQIDLKIKALMQYKSQLKQRDYAQIISGLNMFRGGIKGFKYAEAFYNESL
jgi:LmbE family N-acetylglucosaminyl deacetylase